MIADYHVHTPYCGHAKGAIIDYIRQGIAADLNEIGFADHLGRYYLTATQKRRYWDWGMDERYLARYVAELLDLKETFAGEITIRIGLEVDYVEGAEDLLEPIVSQYPFDFLLGSVHCLPQIGWKHIANYEKAIDAALVYREYFRVARAALKSGLFDALAHTDFIWRYIAWPKRDPAMPFAEIDETVQTAAQSGTCIEINGNGFLWSKANVIDQGDPFDTLIEQVLRHNASISIGSDAHEPGMVAYQFPDLIGLLQAKGIRTTTCFADGNHSQELLG